jgi:monofunctional biosynthetic peptidoglycan transglycosylase
MFWGKERILEVYLNVIETGRGLFGVESVCQRYYQCSSCNLTVEEAAAIACILPKPLTRTPYTVLRTHASKHQKLTREVLKAMEESSLRANSK